MDWYADLIETFLEAAVHTVLHTREIYQMHLFEQRRYLGITVWQCRHPEVVSYIKRVFANMRPLLVQGLVDRLVIVTLLGNKAYDHLTLKCHLLLAATAAAASNSKPSAQQMSLLQEEFRSVLLRLSMTDASLGKLPEGK